MSHKIMVGMLAVCSLATFSVIAADLPEVDEGAAAFDKEMCIKQYADNCINTICITSSALDCNDQCNAAAKDKCEQQADD